ncbi:MAG TPA: LysR substrate-binding domain-containing protein [Acidimicrobiales bacterium]|nr:LysR substrate-binding domain-containing protein [Acidimicrobiales bacterium]
MTFNQLRTFVEVATSGSVTDAARSLLVSPPAVSAAVGSIEKELGVSLVERAGRGLVITPAGEVFARYARQVLALIDTARAATAEALDPERGQLRLAAVTTAGEHVVPRFLASFRDRHPEAGVTLEVGNRDRVWDALADHEADLAVGGRPPGGGRFVTLATRPNVLVLVSAGSGKRAVREVDVATVARSVVLLREEGSGTRGTAEELLDEMGIDPRTLTLGSNGAIRESVQVGLGITLISRDAVARELDEGTLEEWRCANLPRQRAWHVVARAHEPLPATAGLFLTDLVGHDGFTLVRDGSPG